MSYDLEKIKAGRAPIRIISIALPKCANTYGVSPCTASGSAGSECYNTRKSCQDVANYDGSATLTIRLCEPTIEQLGIKAIPCIENIDTAHSVIEPGQESVGIPGGLSIVCNDFPDADRDTDPYWSTRSYKDNVMDQGTYFGKLKARNPYYQGAVFTIESGYIADGYSAANFKNKTYFLEEFDGPDKGNRVKFVAQDITRHLADDRVTYPEVTIGRLTATLAAATTSSFTVSGDADKYATSNGSVGINDEVIEYVTGTNNGDGTFTFTTLTRGVDNTTASEHAADDAVQKCELLTAQYPRDIAYTLYTAAGIPASYLDTTQWDTVADTWLQKTYTRRLTSPKGIATLLGECHVQMNFFTWWDEESSKVKLEAIRPPDYDTTNVYTQPSHFMRDSIEVVEKTDKRVTQVHVYYAPHNSIEGDKPEHFQKRAREKDDKAESDDQYGDSRIRKIYANWITDDNEASGLAARLVNRFRDNVRMLLFNMDAKDEDLNTGDQFYAYADAVPGLDGAPVNTLFQVVQRDELESGSVYGYRAWELFYFGRYGYIGAAGSPNYGSATDEQKRDIGFIASAGGGDFSDDGNAYKII